MRGPNARIAAIGALATALAGIALAWALASGSFDYGGVPDPPKRSLIPGKGSEQSIVEGSLGGMPFATGVPGASPAGAALAAARTARVATRPVSRRTPTARRAARQLARRSGSRGGGPRSGGRRRR